MKRQTLVLTLILLYSLTLLSLTCVSADTIPAGAILPLTNDTIPTNTFLCNGSYSTPDLRDKLIVTAGSSYTYGVSYGSATHTCSYAGGGGGGGLQPTGGNNKFAVGSGTLGVSGTVSSLISGTFPDLLNYPPFIALPYVKVNQTSNLENNEIIWWNGTTTNLPTGCSIYNIYGKFIVGSNLTYSTGTTGGTSSHSHTGNYGVLGTYTQNTGTQLTAGTDYATTDNFLGSAGTNTINSMPYYYGFIPMTCVSNTPISSGMVMAYNGSLSSLPSTYKVLNGTGGVPDLRDRHIQANSTSGAIGGTSTYTGTHSCTFGGTDFFGAYVSGTGFAITGTTLSFWYTVTGGYSTCSCTSWQPPSTALYYIINTAPAVTNSCTYSGTGNWLINNSDNCIINTPYTLNGNIITNGVGTVTFNSTLTRSSNYAIYLIKTATEYASYFLGKGFRLK